MTQGAGIPDRDEQSYLGRMIDEDGIRRRWEAIGSKLDERAQRMFAAAEVRTVLPHHSELARKTADGPCGDRRADRRHDARRIPPRMELHDHASTAS